MTQTIYKQIIYLLVLSTLLIGQYAYSAALSGQITTAKGVGISGAMITVFNEPKTQKHTVFTFLTNQRHKSTLSSLITLDST